MSRLLLLPSLMLAQQAVPEIITFTSPGNPILGDGSLYSADPGPVVVDDKLYVIAGQDAAPIGDNSFVINKWSLLSTDHPNPQGSAWNVQTEFV